MEKFWMWIAWRLPKRLIYWAAIRVAARATSGPDSTSAPELLAMDALKRWETV